MHPRKAIRQAAKALMIGTAPAYATACQDRVFATMVPPLDIDNVIVDEGPVMMIYVREEEEREEDYPQTRLDGMFARRMNLSIEVLAVGAEVDDVLDDIAEQIEALMENWEIPGFPSTDALLINSKIDTTDHHDHILGGLFMGYHLKVHSPYRAGAPGSDADLADFDYPSDVFARPNEKAAEQVVDGPRNGLTWPPIPTPERAT